MLDGAVLVVSAVEGVQAQTRVILRVLRRRRVPTLLFVNKTDRAGADPDAVVRSIPDAVPMWSDLREPLAELDDAALAAYADDLPIPRGTLPRLVAEGRTLPAFRGSAITGEGIAGLMDGIARLLPVASGDPDAPLEATVFAMERGHVARVRVRNGTLRVRDRIDDERVTAIDGGARSDLPAGSIGRVQGLRSVRIGDVLGAGTRTPAEFPPPTLVSTVRPVDDARRFDLHGALRELAEQDPLVDDRSRETRVSLYGEVQKEVIRDTLAEEFGIEAEFGESTVVMRERPAGRSTAGAVLGEDGNPHTATLELRVEPGDGIAVTLEVPHIDVPLYVYGTVAAFRDAMERYVRDALVRGPRGWEVGDARVTVTRCGYMSPSSGAADFRRLTGELIERALRASGTVLCEPVQHLAVEGPADALPAVLSALPGLGARIDATSVEGGRFEVRSVAGADRVTGIERSLPGLTRGEGAVEATFAGWRPVG